MQKETKKKIIMSAVIILIVIVCMIGYAIMMHVQGGTKENGKIKEKIEAEISYLDANLVAMLNSLNNISYEQYKVKTEKTSPQSQEGQEGQQKQEGENQSNENSSNEQSGGENGSGGGEGNSSQSQGDSQQEQGKNKTSEAKQSKMQDNGILNADLNTIDWKTIKQNIEVIYASWNTIAIDLHSTNVNKDDIFGFNTVMQQAIQAVKAEDKKEALIQLANAYALLPKYSETAIENKEKTENYQTKSNILQAYALLEQDKWDEMKKSIITAQEKFSGQMTKVNENKTKQANIQKIYMCLKEMETVCDLKDKELFLMNYKEVIQLIENLG